MKISMLKSFKGKLIFTLLILIVLQSIGLSVTIVSEFMEEEQKVVEIYSDIIYNDFDVDHPGDWKIKENQLLKGEYIVSKDKKINSQLDSYMRDNVYVTIFMGDISIASNLTIDGKRLVGTKLIEEITKEVYENGEYHGEDVVGEKRILGSYRAIKDENDKVIGIWFVGYDEDIILKKVEKLEGKVLFNIALFAVIMISAMIFVIIMLTRKVKVLSDSIEQVGKGDLTGNIDLNISSEFKGIVQGTKDMMSSMTGMIGTIQESTLEVVSNSEVLSDVSGEMYSTSENISASIEEITCTINDQNAEMLRINDDSQKFGDKLNELGNNIQDIAVELKDTRVKADIGKKDMSDVIGLMKELSDDFSRFKVKISNMDRNVSEITGIINVINGIAEQTNLLALNASIEAARAGDSGRGFAVVAEEIRKLAEQSKESSGKISDIIQSIIDNSNEMIEESESVESGLKDGADNIIKSVTSLEEIIEDMRDIVPGVITLNEHVKTIMEDKNNMCDKLSVATNASAEISAASEEISAAVQEMNQGNEEISNMTVKLLELTDVLKAETQKFKIK